MVIPNPKLASPLSLSELLSLRAEFGIELTEAAAKAEAGGGNAMYGDADEERRGRTEQRVQ